MAELNVVFKNYKLVKDKEISLTSDKVMYFIKATNNKGKTSMLNVLLDIMTATENSETPITIGEKEMETVGTITGGDGLLYTFKYSKELGKKSKFLLIRPDGVPIKKVTEIREIFNYVHFTPEQFYQWSLTTEGRKKQRNILLNLLTPEEHQKVLFADARYNTANGTIYLARREKKKELALIEKRSVIITDEQRKYVVGIDDLTVKYAEYVTQQEAKTKAREEFLLKNNPELKDALTTQKEELENEIIELNRQLALKGAALTEVKAKLAKVKIADDHEEQLAIMDKELLDLKTNIDQGDTYFRNCTSILANIEKEKVEKVEIKEYADEILDLDTEIEKGQKAIKEIISGSAAIPEGLEIGDDMITYNGFEFKETDLSKSQAQLAAAQLSLKVNKSPLILLGDAESLGFKVLDQLYKIGKESDRILLFAEHDRNEDDLRVVAYDELNIPDQNVKTSEFPTIS